MKIVVFLCWCFAAVLAEVTKDSHLPPSTAPAKSPHRNQQRPSSAPALSLQPIMRLVKPTVASPTLSPDFQAIDCDLCEHPFLIILGTGRSGSTTLMAMVNELEGYDIGGEHMGIIKNFYEAYQQFLNSPTNALEGNAWSARVMKKRNYLCWLQQWFFLSAGHKKKFSFDDVHGFKEIRYCNDPRVMNFLAMELFPCAKFIVNYRLDIAAQHKSSFRAKSPISQLMNETNNLELFAQQYPQRVYEMPLETYDNLTHWNDLFTFLDKPNCQANSVLHANANGSYNADTRSVINCDMS